MNALRTQPLVEVVVLNWNGGAFLPDCLGALRDQDYPNFRITLVDNGSTDGSVAWAREHAPHVSIIENRSNLGFAAGNNVALRATSAEIVALLNPDVVVSPDWLSQLVGVMVRDERAGIVGSKLWYPDGRTIQHGGGYLRSPQAMPGHDAIGETDTGQADELRSVEYVIGAAVALRSEMLHGIGLFDEGFFLYFEDVDLCARARRAGWQVLYVPTATAVHIESATAIKNSFAYLQRFHTGRWRYVLKHYPASTILGESIAAEAEWLERIDLKERLACALAYQAMVSGWDELLIARARQGSGALGPNESNEARAKLAWLRGTALTANAQSLGALGMVNEQSPEQAIAKALGIPAQMSLAHQQLSDGNPNPSTEGILEVLAALRDTSDRINRNTRYISELQMALEAQAADEGNLAQSSLEVQQQLDELEARLAALGLDRAS